MFVTIGTATKQPPTPADLIRLITDLSNTLYQCLKKKIPIRGSIGIGTFVQEPLIGIIGDHLVGTPVSAAVLFEKEQEWIGISFVPHQAPLYDPLFDNLETDGFVISWPVPTKSGLKKTRVISWPRTTLQDAYRRVTRLFEQHAGKTGEEKYYSTRIFLEHQIRRNAE